MLKIKATLLKGGRGFLGKILVQRFLYEDNLGSLNRIFLFSKNESDKYDLGSFCRNINFYRLRKC